MQGEEVGPAVSLWSLSSRIYIKKRACMLAVLKVAAVKENIPAAEDMY